MKHILVLGHGNAKSMSLEEYPLEISRMSLEIFECLQIGLAVFENRSIPRTKIFFFCLGRSWQVYQIIFYSLPNEKSN